MSVWIWDTKMSHHVSMVMTVKTVTSRGGSVLPIS